MRCAGQLVVQITAVLATGHKIPRCAEHLPVDVDWQVDHQVADTDECILPGHGHFTHVIRNVHELVEAFRATLLAKFADQVGIGDQPGSELRNARCRCGASNNAGPCLLRSFAHRDMIGLDQSPCDVGQVEAVVIEATNSRPKPDEIILGQSTRGNGACSGFRLRMPCLQQADHLVIHDEFKRLLSPSVCQIEKSGQSCHPNVPMGSGNGYTGGRMAIIRVVVLVGPPWDIRCQKIENGESLFPRSPCREGAGAASGLMRQVVEGGIRDFARSGPFRQRSQLAE